MKKIILSLTLILLIISCKQKDKSGSDTSTNETLTTKDKEHSPLRSFHSLADIISDTSRSVWVDKQGSNYSLALHMGYKDSLVVSYSPECWLVFPCRLVSNRLTVFWDVDIDSKYNFDIVKAMKRVDRKLIGQPFMQLELENDTTLKATYRLEELVRSINKSDSTRILFPARFRLVRDGEMYD